MPQRTIEGRVREHFDSLTPAERRLGELVLNFQGSIASYSATELAEMAGISKAAATRFFRSIGYRDFTEARQQVRQARRWGSPIYGEDAPVPAKTRSGYLDRQIRQETANIQRTLEAIRPDRLDEAVDRLQAARRVAVVGFRNSHMLAMYLARQLVLLRDQVALVPAPGQTLGDDLAGLDESDLLIAIGLRRRVPVLRRVMEVARTAGTPILYIADPTANRTARLANWVVIAEVQTGSPFDSYAAVMSVLNLICTQLLRADTAQGYHRLRRVEELHETLAELDTAAWIDPEPR